MKGERGQNNIFIYLTAEEVYRLQSGQTVGDRLGVTHPDAKVEVLPLSVVEEDDSLKDKWSDSRLELGKSAEIKGNLFTNGDLQFVVPAIALSDVRITNLHLRREQISTPSGDDTEYRTHIIPEGGVTIHLEGSLQVIDLYQEL